LLHENLPVMTVTLMGGDMQAQGHAQLLVDILDLGANVQAAADMARFRHSQVSNVLGLESPLYDIVGGKLAAMGHAVTSIDGGSVGGVQVIMSVPGLKDFDGAGAKHGGSGYYRAGSDFRKDGQAVGW
jgi:gamma-glutamyltranspeptidase/glutathione hydrolase